MLPASSAPTRSSIISRLRAAGCVFAEDEARLLMSAASTPADLTAMVNRRAAGLPLEHVIGWAEFCGLRIAVDPGVFIPRPRTEFLVRQAQLLAGQATGPGENRDRVVVLDLCCGSGALGLALAGALAGAELHAADADPAAVRCARRNTAAVSGHVYQGDLYQPLPATLRGRVGILVANVPYVPTGEVSLLPPEARIHEPRAALDGGPDGLDVLRRVVEGAPGWLASNGRLLIETSEGQAPLAADVFSRAGLIPQVAYSAELSATVIMGTMPST